MSKVGNTLGEEEDPAAERRGSNCGKRRHAGIRRLLERRGTLAAIRRAKRTVEEGAQSVRGNGGDIWTGEAEEKKSAVPRCTKLRHVPLTGECRSITIAKWRSVCSPG
jgi:hypothetical protein